MPDASDVTRPGPDSGSLQPTVRASHAAGAVPPEVAAAPAAERIGKFVRTHRLGSGGMGEVWKAWDTQLSRWVALKFLKGSDDEEVARFAREAQLAARLSHPHIGAIFEVGQEAGRHFIAMQFIDGRTLRAFPRTDVRVLVTLIHDAAKAVAYANDAGIIHRDIKPENLMVQTRGADHTVYVMDFGLARATEGASDLSVSGAIVGTPAYMAPEQARGQKVDERADVYSLGATLYELLTSRKPFLGATVYEILRKVQEEDPVAPRRLSPKLDADLETLVLKCLEKEPERRYATATALADDLDRWLQGEPIEAVPPSTTYRLRKFVARRKAVLIPSLFASLVVAGIAAWSLAGASGRAQKVRDHLAEAARLETSGDLAGARDLFAKAAALDSGNAAARAGQERIDGALRDISLLLEVGRTVIDRAELYLRDPRARYDELVRRIDEGQAKIEVAVRRAPRHAVAHTLLGRAWSLKGADDKAEGCWRRAVEIDPAFGPAHFHLGRLLLTRAFLATVSAGDTPVGDRRASSEEFARQGAAAFEAAMKTGSGFDDEVQRLVARVMLAFTARDTETQHRLVLEGLARFKDREGEEEIQFLYGLSLKDPERSLEAIDRALAIRPNYPEALFLHAIRRKPGDFQGAIDDATRAIQFSPRLVYAWFLRGRNRLDLGRFDEAIADYDECLRLSPGWATAHSNRGACRFAKGDIKGALEDLDEALRIEPSHLTALTNRLAIFQKSGDHERALADCDRYLAANPRSAEIRKWRGDILHSRGDGEGAIREFDEALRLDDRHYAASMNRAAVLWHLGRRDAAAEQLDRTIAIDPARPDAWVRRAAMKLELRDLDGAIQDASTAITRGSRDPQAWLTRADARIARGDAAGAAADLESASRITPDDPETAMNLGIALFRKHDLPGALAAFDRALLYNPNHIDALRNRAGLRILRSEYDLAIADCDRGLRLKPDHPSMLYHRGFARFCKNDENGAWSDFEAALKVNPDHADALNLHAVIRGRRGDNDGALAELKRAVALEPGHLRAWINLSTACSVKGDWDGVIDAWNHALALDPKHYEGYYNRAAARNRKGIMAGIAEDLESALKYAPADWKLRAECEQNLKILRRNK
jgi:tetratricopeptide (TPR) repeat protein/predicted Ser/Thr protein kinase